MIYKLINKEILFLFIIYSISSIFIILNSHGLYWDDWVVFNQEKSTVNILMDMIQHGIKGDFVKYMLTFENQIYPSRIFIFFAYFFTGLFIYKILYTIKELHKIDVLYITLFYLIMPVISSRVMISVIPFFLPLLIFYFTFFLLTKHLNSNSYLLRAMILIGFYLSFDTNSILVFYAIVLIYIFYIKYNFTISLHNIKQFVIKYIDFILLPIVYFIIKIIYFKPYCLYSDYNSIGDTPIYKKLLKLISSFDSSLFQVLHESFYISLSLWFIIILLLYFIIKKNYITIYYNLKTPIFFYLGVLLFLLAIFPYIAVVKQPEMDGFGSRFQLLTPIGLAFIFYFGINIIQKYFNLSDKIKIALLFILIFSFVTKNIYTFYKFQVDELYMTSIMMNFKNNNEIDKNTTFIINNNIRDKLIHRREPPYYEWNGMLKYCFNHDTKLAIYYHDYKKLSSYEKVQSYKQYNFSQWKRTKPILVTISYNYKTKDKRMIRKLLLMKLTNYKKYLNEVKKLTLVTTSNFTEEKL